ncbi:hypothetical protein OHR68_12910 [Spirillospora sp. NBC_00431]
MTTANDRVSRPHVYSSEVERVLLWMPAVRDRAIIGVTHDHWGEA